MIHEVWYYQSKGGAMKKPRYKKKQHKPRWKKRESKPRWFEPKTLEEKVMRTLTRRVVKTLNNRGWEMKGPPLEFLGCTNKQLLEHLMRPCGGVFPPLFNIDHVVPISIGENETEVRKLSHYSNLRLMNSEENMRKGASIATDEQVALGWKLLGRKIEKTIRVFVPHVIVPRKKPWEDRIFGILLAGVKWVW
jgi:hypothetical protein